MATKQNKPKEQQIQLFHFLFLFFVPFLPPLSPPNRLFLSNKQQDYEGDKSERLWSQHGKRRTELTTQIKIGIALFSQFGGNTQRNNRRSIIRSASDTATTTMRRTS
jgi:hypothetical protein